MNPKDPSLSRQDSGYLERAVALGRKGWGFVHPNPMVGCVLVRGGEVVGEGYHQQFGGPHAEVNALEAAGEQARGSTAFVSLEPCCHHGKTPPCTEALFRAGVVRVVFGAADPGGISGGGAAALKAAGLDVQGPVFSKSVSRLENPAFFFNEEHHATYVALKLAQTLDGRIAGAPGERTTITGPEAHAETHRLRGGYDGILVGFETALVDDPQLTVRAPVGAPDGPGRPGALCRKPPARLILDSRGRLSPEAKLFQGIDEAPVIVFTSQEAPENAVRELEGAGALVRRVPATPEGLSLKATFEICWEMEIRSILCEGGGRLGSALMGGGFAQRLYLFVAPFVLGEKGVSAFPDPGHPDRWKAFCPAVPPAVFGRDVLLTFDRTD